MTENTESGFKPLTAEEWDAQVVQRWVDWINAEAKGVKTGVCVIGYSAQDKFNKDVVQMMVDGFDVPKPRQAMPFWAKKWRRV